MAEHEIIRASLARGLELVEEFGDDGPRHALCAMRRNEIAALSTSLAFPCIIGQFDVNSIILLIEIAYVMGRMDGRPIEMPESLAELDLGGLL